MIISFSLTVNFRCLIFHFSGGFWDFFLSVLTQKLNMKAHLILTSMKNGSNQLINETFGQILYKI